MWVILCKGRSLGIARDRLIYVLERLGGNKKSYGYLGGIITQFRFSHQREVSGGY